jgi:hypothetical protein
MLLNKYKNIFNKKNTVIIFFIFIVINYLFFNYRIIFRENGYILGDWVVNYSGGFVRRGLLGHFFFSISKYFDISIKYIIFFFSTAIYISSTYFFFEIIKRKLDNYLVLIFILLPSTLLFNFFDPLSVGRKDILIFFFFFFYYLNLEKVLNNFYFKLFILLLFVIILLTHELIFFFIPYLFILKYFHNNRGLKINPRDYYLEILIFFLGSILMFIIFKISHLHNNKVLCDSLLDVNLTGNACWAINDFKNEIIIKSLFPYFIEKKYFINYSFYSLLSLFPSFLLVLQSSNKTQKKIFLFLSVFCLIFSTLFYMQVNDWGRYLNVTFLVHFLIVLKFIEKDIEIKKIRNKLIKSISLMFIFIYLTSWHMPHCCNPNLGTGYRDIYNRIIFRLNDNSTETTKYIDRPRQFLRMFFNISQN